MEFKWHKYKPNIIKATLEKNGRKFWVLIARYKIGKHWRYSIASPSKLHRTVYSKEAALNEANRRSMEFFA